MSQSWIATWRWILVICLTICGLLLETNSQSQSTIYAYLGCYEDRNDITLFNEFSLTNSTISFANPDNCVAACLKFGKIYGGVSGQKCFCSDDYAPQIVKTIDSECNPKWLSENADFAKNPRPRLAVYGTGLTVNTTYPAKIYLGCYREENSEFRLLKGSWQQLATNSPNTCHKLCLKTGFRYFGLTYKEECFCGETGPSENVLVDNSECNLPCPGDKTEKCGGGWITSVYATGITDIPSHGRYVGCYKNPEEDESYIADFKITLKNSNSPRRCLNICDQGGYEYAAVQDREQCLCSNQKPPNSTVDTLENCNQAKCPGDPSDFCGGKSSLKLYRTRKSENSGDKEYMGCYATQQENPLLAASKISLPYTLTTDTCIAICKERGYPVAGVIFGKNCHCDYYYGSALSLVDDKECISRCSGDPNELCGGPLRYSMYFTGLSRSGILPASIYKGCFRDDNTANRLISGSWQQLENDSPQICQQLCYRTGYLHFGLSWIKECFCGDQNPNADFLVDESECNKPCGGDSSKICGGGWRTNAYSTGLVEQSVGDRYLGCFDDSASTSILPDMTLLLSNTNSPARCLSICHQNGYRFAGVKRGADCHCGNNFSPEQSVKEDENNCTTTCPGDSTDNCGKSNKMRVYTTSVSTPWEQSTKDPTGVILIREDTKCGNTYSTKNKQKVCKGEVLFSDTFEKLDDRVWKPERKLASRPDYQFVTYTCSPDNVGIANGKLYIRPVLQPDNLVNGVVNIQNCTGKKPDECSKRAAFSNILPPVTTARITTENSFSFRYGIVDVRAQFPVGDWIVGEIWLTPKDVSYGDDYQSGQIRIAMVRGNKNLACGGKDLGHKTVEVGIYVGLATDVKTKTYTKFVQDGWTSGYHNYTLVWTPDNLQFSIDGEKLPSIISSTDDTIQKVTGQPSNAAVVWKDGGSRLAPFDKDFFISLGVSVGGIRDFPDNCISGSIRKPWTDQSTKAMLNFWRARNDWSKTWPKDKNVLNIDYIKVTAL